MRDVLPDDVVDDHILGDVGHLVVVLARHGALRVVEQQVEVLVQGDEVHLFLRHVLQEFRRVVEVHTFPSHVHGTSPDSILLVEVNVEIEFTIIR